MPGPCKQDDGSLRVPEVWTDPLAVAYAENDRKIPRELAERFGYAFLTDEQVEAVRLHTCDLGFKLVSVAAGRGYPARQLREAGCDVIAYSESMVEGVLPGMLEGPHSRAADHPDRALFMSFPNQDAACDIPSVIRSYAAAGGNILALNMVFMRRSQHNCGSYGSDVSEVLQKCRQLAMVQGPEWNCPDAMFSRDHAFVHVLPYKLGIYDCSSLRDGASE